MERHPTVPFKRDLNPGFDVIAGEVGCGAVLGSLCAGLGDVAMLVLGHEPKHHARRDSQGDFAMRAIADAYCSLSPTIAVPPSSWVIR